MTVSAASKGYDAMSREELLEALARLEDRLTDELTKLHMHEEELRAQHASLLEAQHLLEASRDRYADLYEFAPLAYVTLDPYGVIEELNLTAARLLETERGRLIGYPFAIFVVEGHRSTFFAHMSRCRQSAAGEHVTTEIDVTLRRGATLPVQLISRRAAAAVGGRAMAFHTAVLDLSERRLMEGERLRALEERQQLLHEEQLARTASESKDRFVAMVSHELRGPLTPIVFTLARLRALGDLPAPVPQALEMIARNVQLEARLIDDLLDFTRVQRDKLHLERTLIDVHEIIGDVAAMAREQSGSAGVALEVALDAGEHHVFGDEVRIRQALANLVSNAFRHTPAGGRVTIRSENPRPDVLRLEVRDTGMGIAPETVDRLFTPFVQGERPPGGGLGLGLAIAKGIIDGHDGRLEASSPGLGRGAVFAIELTAVRSGGPKRGAQAPEREAAPLPDRERDDRVLSDTERDAQPLGSDPGAAAAPGVDGSARIETPCFSSPPASSAEPAGDKRGVRVLLVEDNRDAAEALTEYLRAVGYDVRAVGSVEAALAEASNGFDVLLSDLGLPDGTGQELVRTLRARQPVRAIALTGYGTEADRASAREAGFLCHLTKPVNPEKLIEAIKGAS